MSGGILGLFGAPQAQGQGILGGGFNEFANDNSTALLQAAAGLLSGQGMAGAMSGFAQGMTQDERIRQVRQAAAEKEQRKVSARQWAQKNGLDPALAEDPDTVFAIAAQRYKPRDPQLIGSAETGYTWATPGQALPEQFTKGSGPKATDDIREYQTARAQGYQGTFLDYQKELKRAGAQNINVGGGSDKQIFDALKESSDSARSAATGLTSIEQARQAVQAGGFFGAGAENRLALQKIGAQLGVADPSKIVNTETFRAAIAPQVASTLRQVVGSANISNSDREFAEKAAGGSIQLDQGSITRLLDIMERANGAILDQHQQRLDAVYPDGGEFKRERALFGVQRPQSARGALGGVDRAALEAEARRRGLFK